DEELACICLRRPSLLSGWSIDKVEQLAVMRTEEEGKGTNRLPDTLSQPPPCISQSPIKGASFGQRRIESPSEVGDPFVLELDLGSEYCWNPDFMDTAANEVYCPWLAL